MRYLSIAAILLAFNGVVSAQSSFDREAFAGCMETCSPDGDEEICRSYCTCQLSFLSYSFEGLGLTVFTPQQYPRLFAEATMDGGRYCSADSDPQSTAVLSDFFVACMEPLTGVDTDNAAWCTCAEDEIDRFRVSVADKTRLTESARTNRLGAALDEWADDDYPDLGRRVRSCAAGRSPYTFDAEAIALRRSIEDPGAARACVLNQMIPAADACTHTVGTVPRRNLDRCESRVEVNGASPICRAVGVTDIEAFVQLEADVRDKCVFWGVYLELFRDKLVELGCLPVSSLTRLRLAAARVPEAATQLVLSSMDGALIENASMRNSMPPVYTFEVSVDRKQYAVDVSYSNPDWQQQRRQPISSDFEILEVADPAARARDEERIAGPYTPAEGQQMSSVWRTIRSAARYEDINWIQLGVMGPPGNEEAREMTSRYWSQLRGAARFEDIDWQATAGFMVE